MIVQQVVAMAEPLKAIDDMGEQGEPPQPVAVIHHDVLLGDAAGRERRESSGAP